MAEYSAIAVQTVTALNNILFTENPVRAGRCIVHRDGSGIFTLRGITENSRAIFKVTFNANIAAVTTATPISLGVAINGEVDNSTTMIVTPAATGEYFNVSSSTLIDVTKGCCLTISIENTSAQDITVQNANVLIERVA